MRRPPALRGRLGLVPPRRRPGADRGSFAIELAILAPVLVFFVLIAVAAGRIQTTGGVVDAAARSGARAASLARSPEGAEQAAHDAVAAALAGQGVLCEGAENPPVQYGTLSTPDGPLTTVTVRVSCKVRLADLLAGLPAGTKTMTGTFTSVLDRYRATG
ncbi:TadE/TadG family type IV pilus assembly protein [Kitasatospora sp. NPDC051853]|uniref:TadE/TadG family type IV pilus assembly protein n=1 Tax=Kitasatospora sp. NPDC051853 TaxID=3364058 RepID=UPI0037BB1D09